MIDLSLIKKEKTSKENIIGKKIKIISSSNKNNISLEGVIIKETKNTFDIISKGKRKRIVKKGVTFEIKNSNEKKKIKGERIIKKIEERLKSKK